MDMKVATVFAEVACPLDRLAGGGESLDRVVDRRHACRRQPVDRILGCRPLPQADRSHEPG
jgi:hypothetical protein